jgi:hypothetical protein
LSPDREGRTGGPTLRRNSISTVRAIRDFGYAQGKVLFEPEVLPGLGFCAVGGS